MRLTLRTLLAYMDSLLDPKDSQEIGKKIEDSKFATDLFHKIRDVMRRLRLAAPSITERGANLDCNTVAEYLDNVMPGDRVPDFEEVCLKSDVHLAEVASCHQILTMVLGEPAEIDPEGRQRMYQLPTVANRVDEEHQAAVEAANVLSADGNGPLPSAARLAKVRPRPVVPEYLRDPPHKWQLLPAAAIMLLVGAAIGLLVVMFSANARQWLQAKWDGKPAVEEPLDQRESSKPAKPTGNDTARPSDASNAGVKDSGSLAATGNPSETPVSEGVPEKPTPKNLPSPGPAAGAALSTTAAATLPAPSATGSDSITKSPTASVADRGAKLPAGSPPTIPPVAKPGGTGPTAGGPVIPPGPGKSRVGRFTSDGPDVLLKFEPGNAGWRRVLPEEFLVGRQPLLSLPCYRPPLLITSAGATLEMVNGTRIELLPDNAQGLPGVDIDFGCLVIKPSAQDGARLRLGVGSHSGTITLTGGDSIAGLEVTRVHDPGKDPEKVSSHPLTKLYMARGSAVWEEEGKQPLRLLATATLTLDGGAGDEPSGTAKGVPNWLTTNTINESDQRSAHDVAQALSSEHAAGLSLMELTVDRRRDVHGLAARCLGYLGQFDPITAALNDLDFRAKWSDYIDQLKEAVARGPETAAAIRQSLEKQYGNDAAGLYRMLWGYTDKDLEDGEDARLVKYLDDESPIFRALAIWNLKDITHKTLSYQPEATTAAKRLKAVQQWRRQLQLGWIRFNLPDVTPSRTAPAEVPTGPVREPPKPLKVGTPSDPNPAEANPAETNPAEVTPTSATESLAPRSIAPGSPADRETGTAAITRPPRAPVSVPDPEPPESRPPVAVPEP